MAGAGPTHDDTAIDAYFHYSILISNSNSASERLMLSSNQGARPEERRHGSDQSNSISNPHPTVESSTGRPVKREVCPPLRATDPLPSSRRARPLIPLSLCTADRGC